MDDGNKSSPDPSKGKEENDTNNHSTNNNEEPVAGTSAEDGTKRKAATDQDKADNRDRKTQRTEMSENIGNENGNARLSGDDLLLQGALSLSRSSSSSSLTSSSSSSSTMSILNRLRREKATNVSEPTPEVLQKPKPKHKWFMTPEIIQRGIGHSNSKPGAKRFEERFHGSLHSVQRLELMYKLQAHTGCVNCVNFNESGTILASTSDDLQVCLWDWAAGKLLTKLPTGHKSNVFQSKFLPLQGHGHIVTCARDGQVRLLELDSSGSLRSVRRLAAHTRASHKVALIAGSQHCFLSCGEDALVLNHDIRQPRAFKMLKVREEAKLIPLYSVSCHPFDTNELMVGGCDRFVRVYDRRLLTTPLLKLTMAATTNFTPRKKNPQSFVTCAVYNYNGTELLASYNDDDIYLWDRTDASNKEYVHKYQGHRNNATIKGVNFFGPRSEFVMSGSDCGNIFFWDRETEAIVQWMAGDEHGVVNCLEPHPSIPVIATSGLDDDVKIWVPSCEQEPTFEGLKSAVIINHHDREDEHLDLRRGSDIDAQMLWLLWRHLRRSPMSSGHSNVEAQAEAEPNQASVLYAAPPESPQDSPSNSLDDSSDPEGDDLNLNYPDCSPS